MKKEEGSKENVRLLVRKAPAFFSLSLSNG
jgi:hypothetical protein